MSGGAILQASLRLLRRAQLPEETERDLVAVLDAAQPGPLTLIYEAGHAAGLGDAILLPRAAAVFCVFAAGNLADDLADGDCDYLTPPLRLGPGAQFVLHSLAFAELATLVPAEALADFARALVESSALQQLEVRTHEWSAARYRQIGDAIAGRQWAAYLGILWHGSSLHPRAREIGQASGFLGFVAGDVRSRDRRWTSLSNDDRALVAGWAREAIATLERQSLGFARAVAADAASVLA